MCEPSRKKYEIMKIKGYKRKNNNIKIDGF